MNAKTERKDKRNFKKMEGERDFDIVVCRNEYPWQRKPMVFGEIYSPLSPLISQTAIYFVFIHFHENTRHL